jgi:hypothetical protein
LVVDTGRPLGRGTYGTVRRADWLGTAVAIKQAPVGDESAIKAMLRELRALQALLHPFIVQLLGFVDAVQAGELWAVLEYATHGSLEKVLALDEARARDAALCASPSLPGVTRCWLRAAAQIVTALAFLHARGVVHGDLKPANALVFDSGVIKISDFGLALLTRSMHSASRAGSGRSPPPGARGTAAYAAPDAAEGDQPTPADDVFSLGIMLCEMLSGEVPYARFGSELKIMFAISKGERPALPVRAPEPWRALISSCWSAAPSERPTTADVRARLSGWLSDEQGHVPEEVRTATVTPMPPSPVRAPVVGTPVLPPAEASTCEGLVLEAKGLVASAMAAKDAAAKAARDASNATAAAALQANELAARANGGRCMALLLGSKPARMQAANDAAAREASARAHGSRAADAAAMAVVALDRAVEAEKAARLLPSEAELSSMAWRPLGLHLSGTANLCTLVRANGALAAAHAELVVNVIATRTASEGEADVAIRAGGLLPQLSAMMRACAGSARLQEAALAALCNL